MVIHCTCLLCAFHTMACTIVCSCTTVLPRGTLPAVTEMLQVGKTGLSVGIDIRKTAVKLSTSNIKRLRSTSQDFATQASSCKFELHNVFMPSNKHKVSSIKHQP